MGGLTVHGRAPLPDWPLHGTDHVVQFYETDTFLAQALSEFISSGLAAGEACIVVATPSHRAQLDERLQSAGLDIAAAQASGQYVCLDAQATLARFMAAGMPQPRRFAEVIGPVIARAGEGGRRVRVFGEMVALLLADGHHEAALRLEELWNDLLHTRHDFALLCAYPIHQFSGEAFAQPLKDVCAAHGRVIPAESYTSLTDPNERLGAVIQLQQQARSLQAEIAERKAAQERLRISELRYQRVFETLRRREQDLTDFFEHATVALHWVGPDGTILWANRAELELLGYTHDEYVGRHIAKFHDDPEVIADILARLARGEALHDYEARLRCKDGSIRYVLISSNVHWEDGRFIHTRCFTRDITERKQAEQERELLLARERAARVEAQEAVRIRDVFLSIAAHELRTPLTSLLGNAQLLLRRSEGAVHLTDRGVKPIRVIAEQAKRLNRMIMGLLEVSRIETGRLSIDRTPVDLSALARRIVDEVQPTLYHHIIDCQTPNGAVVIEGDEVRLEQVVQNLLTNAIKYSPHGGPVIVRVEQHGQQARLQVTDLGIGIPRHEQPHVFQRFYRGSNADAQFLSGMGIGLYVVNEIVALHGGSVAVDSSEGTGSTFTVALPPALGTPGGSRRP